jgi:diguanylate cyclase (GGDEF)-like protein
LQEKGFGEGPDGSRLTASIGLAERNQDHTLDWRALVEKADHRMYQAKQLGRNRAVIL